ncbi:MAG: hypothetical protein II855_05035 [Candidatus Methanomethylophilaceae archaeon]|nr:hypothetical protein [Candidatus Methanomethylophilaceae archaeon]
MKKKVLVLAKAEPAPSSKYGASVCTAGVTDEGEFIRLYPIPYTIFCDSSTRFSKYDWIEVECERSDTDKRPESYKVKPETIRVVGHIGTDYNWAERNSIVLPLLSDGINELKAKGVSLGLIKPTRVLDLYRDKTDTEDEIREEYRKTFQMVFDTETERMKKIPVIKPIDVHYSYKFECAGDPSVHDIMCEDWELYQSARSWPLHYGNDEQVVWEKIHEKYYDKFTTDNDLYFFVGTHFRFKTWIIIGLYYPPKVKWKQTTLLSKSGGV